MLINLQVHSNPNECFNCICVKDCWKELPLLLEPPKKENYCSVIHKYVWPEIILFIYFNLYQPSPQVGSRQITINI